MINKLKPKSEFSRNVLTLMTGTTIAQAIPIAISPILTRLYTPEDFGIFALFGSVVMIFSAIATGRYELAIMLPKKDEDAIQIVFLSIFISFLISIVTFLIMFFFNSSITGLLGNEAVSSWLYFVPIAVLFSGLYQSFNYWHNRKKRYKAISVSKVLQSATGATSNLSLGYFGLGSAGLIISNLLAQGIATAILGKISFKNNKIFSINKIKIIALAKKYRKFPIYNTQHTLINIVFSQMPILVLSKFFNASTIGFYALSMRVVQTPITIIGNAFANVLYEKIVNKRNNREKYMNQIFKFLRTQIVLAIFLFIGIYILSNYMEIIFGKNWSEVGVYIKLLIPWLFMVFVVSPLSFSINMTNNQEKGLYLEWIYGGTKFGSLLLGALYFNNIGKTLILFSVTNALFLLYQANWFINLLKEEEL